MGLLLISSKDGNLIIKSLRSDISGEIIGVQAEGVLFREGNFLILRDKELKEVGKRELTKDEIEDLHVKSGNLSETFLGVLARLLKRGVEIRLIHAKEPGSAFREDFDRYPILRTGLERILCPRVHFKMLIFYFESAYIGSANLIGAVIGMKSSIRRNFEAGILTDYSALVEAASEQFDSV